MIEFTYTHCFFGQIYVQYTHGFFAWMSQEEFAAEFADYDIS